MKKAGIIGFASWFPETVRNNSDWPQAFVDNFNSKNIKEELKTLVDLKAEDTDNAMVIEYLQSEMNDPFFGTVERRVAPDSVDAVEAETLAARAVLQKTGINSEEITILISFSTLPDRIAPTSGNAVAFNIGATKAHCIGVDTGCASVLSQMMIAQSLIESGHAKYVLLVQSHLVLRGWAMMHPASPNVGDGATAMLMGPSDKHRIVGSYALSDGSYYTSVTYTRGKKEDDSPWWKSSDKAFYLGSYDSAKAKKLIMNTINAGKEAIQQAISPTPYQINDIDLVLSVQPRKWVPEGIAISLGLQPSAVVQTFEKYAHLGPCGVIANLEEAESQSKLKPDTLVALYAQGAGFCTTSVIIKW